MKSLNISSSSFQEIDSSLQINVGIKRQIDLENKGILVKILETHTPLYQEGCNEEIIKSVRLQASELYSHHTCPLFPVIIHGHFRSNLIFKYSNKDEVVGVKLPSLRFATIGSPLVDIYNAVHSAKSHHETSKTIRGHLQTYHASFNEVIQYLRLGQSNFVREFTLESLEVAFKKYELTGMVMTSVKRPAAAVELGRSYSLGGRDMLLREQQNVSKLNNIHDLGSDLSKLTIDIPFSHDEDDEDIFEQEQKDIKDHKQNNFGHNIDLNESNKVPS